MFEWFEKHNKISLTITLIIAVAIFYISSLTFKPGIPGINIKSILYHLTAFFFLALFLQISLIKKTNKSRFPIAIAMAILYAISDELHQFLVPGRYCSLNDVFTDATGIAFATVIYLISIRYRELFRQNPAIISSNQ